MFNYSIKLLNEYCRECDLISAAKKEIRRSSINVVSFDVFDTLVHRRCSPEAVVYSVCIYLEEKLRGLGYEPGDDVALMRERAYQKLIYLKADSGLDLDVSLDDLCFEWVRSLVGDKLDVRSLAQEVAEYEGKVERDVCFANRHFLDFARALANSGYRLIFISDMYLGKKYVAPILERCGFQGLFKEGYVSGDSSLLKRSGRLFDFVMQQEGLTPESFIHIGDNRINDGMNPSQKGIRSFVFENKRLRSREEFLRREFERFHRNKAWSGFFVSSFSEPNAFELATYEELYGAQILGPIFANFVHRIVEICKERKVEKVFFLAREGFVLRDIYERFRTGNGTDSIPPSEYLYVSRLSTFLGISHGVGLREILATSANNGKMAIKDMLAPYGIEKGKLDQIAIRYGFQSSAEILPPNFLSWPPFIDFLEDRDLNASIKDKYRISKQHLEQYLRESGFLDCESLAIVDVGWGGQIQGNLSVFCRELQSNIRIEGIYLGVTPLAHYRKQKTSWIHSVMGDQADLRWLGNSCFDFVQGIEAVIRAPHGTTIGYQHEAGMMSPILKASVKSRLVEEKDDERLALFQSGIIGYARKYSMAVQLFKINSSMVGPYARHCLYRMIRNPSPTEAIWLLGIDNVSDLGSDTILRLGEIGDRYVFRLKKLFSIARSSFWGFGTISIHAPPLLRAFSKLVIELRGQPRTIHVNPELILLKTMPEVETKQDFGSKCSSSVNDIAKILVIHERLVAQGKRARSLISPAVASFRVNEKEICISYIRYRIGKTVSRLRGMSHPIWDGINPRIILRDRFLSLNNKVKKLVKLGR